MLKYLVLSALLLTACTIKQSNGEKTVSSTEQACITELQKQTSDTATITKDSDTTVKLGNDSTYTGNFTVENDGQTRKATCKVTGPEEALKTEVTFE